MRPITSVPSMHCIPAQIIGDFFTHKKRILQGQHWTPVVTNKSSGICKEFFTCMQRNSLEKCNVVSMFFNEVFD